MKPIGVDPDCVDLAHHFLTADPLAEPISDAQASRNLQSLSEKIQQAIEDWFFERDHEEEK